MTLNQEVAMLKKQIAEMIEKIKNMSQNLEDKNQPYSKVGISRILGNKDTVFDGTDGIWKTYAIYKDDEEEE